MHYLYLFCTHMETVSTSFLKLMRSGITEQLVQHPNAFAVLTLVALRARRTGERRLDGLQEGEAMLGDYASLGLTRQQYRTILSNLQAWHLITIRTTNKGTIAKLCNSDVYDINSEASNQPATSDQPAPNQRPTTNKKDKKERKKEDSSFQSESGPAEPMEVVEGEEGEADLLLAKKKQPQRTAEPEHFAAFWQVYPRKEARATALTSFRKLSEEEQANAAGWARDFFARRSDWLGPNGEDFRPHPSTWLNKRRWTDLYEVTIQPQDHGHASPQHAQRNAVNPHGLVNHEKRNAGFAILASMGL